MQSVRCLQEEAIQNLRQLMQLIVYLFLLTGLLQKPLLYPKLFLLSGTTCFKGVTYREAKLYWFMEEPVALVSLLFNLPKHSTRRFLQQPAVKKNAKPVYL